MNAKLRRVLKLVPGTKLARHILERVRLGLFLGTDPKSIFEAIYAKHSWGGESLSGQGSSYDQTKVVAKRLPGLIESYQIKSVLDIPCGDCHWINSVDLQGAKYIGGDIVEGLVITNLLRFPGRDFRRLDIITNKLPNVDLILCRDCLCHFSFPHALAAIDNIRKSGAEYFLSTTFPGRKNESIPTGSWYPINLQAAPFNLPEPMELINERCTLGDEQFADKCLGLWKL